MNKRTELVPNYCLILALSPRMGKKKNHDNTMKKKCNIEHLTVKIFKSILKFLFMYFSYKYNWMSNRRFLTTQSIKICFGGKNGMGKQVQRKGNTVICHLMMSIGSEVSFVRQFH